MTSILRFLFILAFAAILPTASSQQAQARPESQRPTSKVVATGSGIVVMDVDYRTGKVSNVRILKSTGNRVLDKAAITAFSNHSYRPRTFRGRVQVPISFTLTDEKKR